jgi:ABC transporter substrate binding protein
MQCSEPQGEAMRRRDFITHIGGVAVVWPLVAQAQEPGRTYRLAFLIPSPRQAPATIALFDELHRNGFSEGQNLVVIPDGFEADTEHPGELAAALVKAAPDAIITGPALPLRAFQTITHTIPLIGMTEDMVAEGLVASLARPGGNITGLSLLSLELDTKRQEILIEAVPGASNSGNGGFQRSPNISPGGAGARSALAWRRALGFSRRRARRDHICNRRRKSIRRRGAEFSSFAAIRGTRQPQ